MSVLLSKIISTLVHPLNLTLYGLLFALLLRAVGLRRLALTCAATASLWLWFWSTPFFAEPILSRWEQRHPPVAIGELPSADWVVVLGGGLMGSAPPARLHAELGSAADRVWLGAELIKAGVAQRVIVTGGTLPWNGQTSSESEAMLDFMRALGVDAGDITLESESQTTRENATYSAPLIGDAKRAILVTSAFHMERSLRTMRNVMPDIEWIPASTDIMVVPRANSLIRFLPDSETLQNAQRYLRERVGIAVYIYRDWI
ncbi:MAG: YdcF family protein [Litorivicinus sp.]